MRPWRELGVGRPLTPDIVAEARRVARRRVVIKERQGSPVFDELGVDTVVGGRKSRIAYGVITAETARRSGRRGVDVATSARTVNADDGQTAAAWSSSVRRPSGKTAFCIELAGGCPRKSSPPIRCKCIAGMDIGTAKPTRSRARRRPAPRHRLGRAGRRVQRGGLSSACTGGHRRHSRAGQAADFVRRYRAVHPRRRGRVFIPRAGRGLGVAPPTWRKKPSAWAVRRCTPACGRWIRRPRPGCIRTICAGSSGRWKCTNAPGGRCRSICARPEAKVRRFDLLMFGLDPPSRRAVRAHQPPGTRADSQPGSSRKWPLLLERGLDEDDVSMKGLGYKEIIGYLQGPLRPGRGHHAAAAGHPPLRPPAADMVSRRQAHPMARPVRVRHYGRRRRPRVPRSCTLASSFRRIDEIRRARRPGSIFPSPSTLLRSAAYSR